MAPIEKLKEPRRLSTSQHNQYMVIAIPFFKYRQNICVYVYICIYMYVQVFPFAPF